MRLILAFAMAAWAAASLSAQPAPAGMPYPEFTARAHKEADGKFLPYRLLVPKGYDAAKSWPLVIWLHGSGEKGVDNRRQLAGAVVDAFLPEAAREKFPCFVMVPQCPDKSSWTAAHINKVADVPEPVRMTVATIAELRREFSIDERRIYVGGFSMGAFGAWEMICRYPDLAAAAFPMAGTPPGWEKLVPRLKGTPVWIFHGDRDGNAPVAAARALSAALKQAGGDVTYTEYPGAGHNCTPQAFAEPKFLPWLFAQKRSRPPSFEAVAVPEDAVSVIHTIPEGTHGTWAGPVHRTAHGAARVVIGDVAYRLVPGEGCGEKTGKLLDRIGKGELTGRYEVTGTITMDDSGRVCIAVEDARAVE